MNDKNKTLIKVGDYLVDLSSDSNLPSGGNGTIYDVGDGIHCIKVFYQTTDENRYERFKREYQVMRDLAEKDKFNRFAFTKVIDANLPDYKIVKEKEGYAWIEMVKHKPLKLKPMGLEQKVLALKEIFESLVFLHENGYSHRDIKPKNILYGTDGRFYIIDFGLTFNESEEPLSNDGNKVGPRGCPPELQNIDFVKQTNVGNDMFFKSDHFLFGKLCWCFLNDEYELPFGYSLISDEIINPLSERYLSSDHLILPLLYLMDETIRYNYEERADKDRIRELIDLQLDILRNKSTGIKLDRIDQKNFLYLNRQNPDRKVYDRVDKIIDFFTSFSGKYLRLCFTKNEYDLDVTERNATINCANKNGKCLLNVKSNFPKMNMKCFVEKIEFTTAIHKPIVNCFLQSVQKLSPIDLNSNCPSLEGTILDGTIMTIKEQMD